MRNCECDSLVMVVDCRTCTYRMEGIYSDEWFAIRERVCTQYGFTYWVLIYSFRLGRKAIVLDCCSSVPPSNVLQLEYRNWWEKGMRTQREVFVRCLWGVCEVSVRCFWGVCEVSVRFLWGVCEVFVRFLWGVCEVFVRCLWGVCEVFVRCL